MNKEISFVRELYEKYPFPNRPLPQDLEEAKKKLIDNVQWILTSLNKKFDEKQNILDIGCGTGEITTAFWFLFIPWKEGQMCAKLQQIFLREI